MSKSRRKPSTEEPSSSLSFRKRALRELTNQIGVYALCDLDGAPIYVEQSVKGIRGRVSRHLTSARSDVIANRQVDVWEIAFVNAWPVEHRADIPRLEASVFREFDRRKTLMNGSIPQLASPPVDPLPAPAQTVQVMSNEDIDVRRDPALRLPRQIEHIGRLVDHILNVKDSAQLRRSLAAHFKRLDAYREAFLKQGAPVIRAAGEDEEAE